MWTSCVSYVELLVSLLALRKECITDHDEDQLACQFSRASCIMHATATVPYARIDKTSALVSDQS